MYYTPYGTQFVDRSGPTQYDDFYSGSTAMEETASRVHQLENDSQSEWPLLLYSPLSYVYHPSFLKHSWPTTVIVTPILYPLGMIGYVIAFPIRVLIVVYAVLAVVIAALILIGREGYFEKMRLHVIFAAGALGELISGAIGCACPIVAYKLDEWIQSYPTMHKLFYDKWLSVSRQNDRMGGLAEDPVYPDQGGEEDQWRSIIFWETDGMQFGVTNGRETLVYTQLIPYDLVGQLLAQLDDSGNQDRVRNKEQIAQKWGLYAQEARKRLAENEELRENIETPVYLDSIMIFAFYLGYLKGESFDELLQYIEDSGSLKSCITRLKEAHESLKKGHCEDKIQEMLVQAIADHEEKRPIDEVAKPLFKALLDFQQAWYFKDRELGALLPRLAYPEIQSS